jgi:hypothetical protein
VDGTDIVSRLIRGPEGYEREDYAASAWNESLREQAVSVWKRVYLAPPAAPAEPLKKETVESLLRQVIDLDQPEDTGLIFILAVMLERKRILVERDVDVRDDGQTVRVYEHRGTQETFLIRDPQLKLVELQDLQLRVEQKLGIERPPAPEDPAPTESSPSGD